MSVIIDRRLNDRNKSAANRERFMRRYKDHIKRAVSDMISDRSIKDMQRGGSVSIPKKDISEPQLRHGSGGDHEMILPGNREFNAGDKLQRPPSGGEGNGDGEGGEGSGGEDDFIFTMSREEFMNIFFDDLELPHMIRTHVGGIQEYKPQRAGYTKQGSPTNLSVVRTMRGAVGRRLALSGAAKRRLAELEATQTDDETCDPRVEEEIRALRTKIARVPFLDEIDLRFRNRIMIPKPMSQAVMFCLMDVSASMDEHRKDLAKRFYTLLYLFLSRKYETVDVVFIRHTDDAEEVDEDTFFNDRKTGGTVVLSALKLMHEIIGDRYGLNEWNVYGAQASDGDAFGVDPEKSRGFLEDEILTVVRHFAYIEVSDQRSRRASTLSSAYQRINSDHFSTVDVAEHRDIYPVFRKLFGKRNESVKA